MLRHSVSWGICQLNSGSVRGLRRRRLRAWCVFGAGFFEPGASPSGLSSGSFVFPPGCQLVSNICWSKWLGPDSSKRFVYLIYTLEAQGHAGYREHSHEAPPRELRILPGMSRRGWAQHHSNDGPGSELETMQSRRQRCCPSAGPSPPPRPPAPSMPSGTSGAGVPGGSQPLQGSVQAAGSGLVLHGADAHVLDLVRDRDLHTGYPRATLIASVVRSPAGGTPRPISHPLCLRPSIP